jgi:hypothetical protein
MFHPRAGAWRQIRDRTRYSIKKSRAKAAFQQETNRSSGQSSNLALLPIGHVAHAREAKDHHRPGGWLGDSSDRGAGNAEIVKTDHESKAGVAFKLYRCRGTGGGKSAGDRRTAPVAVKATKVFFRLSLSDVYFLLTIQRLNCCRATAGVRTCRI